MNLGYDLGQKIRKLM